MYEKNSAARNHAGEAERAPTECPACRSSDVKTTSKVVNAESYWRCESCGEVWNAARRRTMVYSGRFRA